MITIFNRKELFVTFSMQKQSKIRDILSANNIDYKIKVLNNLSPSNISSGIRSNSNTLGINTDLTYEYIFYVHKTDYDEAMYLLSKSGDLFN